MTRIRYHGRRECVACVGVVLLLAVGSVASAVQDAKPFTVPANAKEQELIESIRALRGSLSPTNQDEYERLRLFAEALLERFATSNHREEATIAKLTAIAGLARTDSHAVQSLIELTESIGRGQPSGTLAAENAFFAIQAFVLGARLEHMPQERRALGTRERYIAFLEDYPKSRRVPVVAASLVRSLLSERRIEASEKWVALLRREHPTHPATRRAAGELRREKTVGARLAIKYTTPSGSTLDLADHPGKTVVLHFWTSAGKASVSDLLRLGRLLAAHPQTLQVIGFNVDVDKERAAAFLHAKKIAWPQFADGRGINSDLLVDYGVIHIPTFFVIDRRGILRAVDHGAELEAIVESLLTEQPAKPSDQPKPKPAKRPPSNP